MSDVEFDTSGLTALSASITRAALGASVTVRKAVEVTSRRVKDDWNSRLYTDGHADRTGHAITYDIDETDGIESKIGADRGSGRQAGIVRLLENGSVHNAPHGYGSAALDAAIPDFVAGIEKAVDGLIL